MTHPIEPHKTDKQRALDLYKPPFRYSSSTNTILDGEGEIAVSLCCQRLYGELIAEALNEYYDKRKEVKCDSTNN
jgi:hypothetical protein